MGQLPLIFRPISASTRKRSFTALINVPSRGQNTWTIVVKTGEFSGLWIPVPKGEMALGAFPFGDK